MTNEQSLDLSKLRIVKINTIFGFETEFLCIEQNEGVWRETEETYQVHRVRLVRRPGSQYTPNWEDAISKSYYASHEVRNFI